MTANLLSCQEATEVSVRALTRHGASQENARIQTEQWVEAELRGRASHGLLRLPRIVERLQKGLA
ncbi:Ldh family oxidoreductase, partial [Klebsiella pneumoniae]|uniref:Ldh family oxidoreductase n=1 Tax=Klebsiella pneumoniae TaxID=573 RepID=UPI003B5B8649